MNSNWSAVERSIEEQKQKLANMTHQELAEWSAANDSELASSTRFLKHRCIHMIKSNNWRCDICDREG